MRDREMARFEARHPDLAGLVGAWHEAHPRGMLEDAVRDLGLWPDPQDRDAQWFVWRYLPAPVRAVRLPGGGSGHPLRDLVADTLRDRIADGTYPPGGQLPRFRAIAEEHTCSVQPVASAYALLAAEGLITGHRRKYWVAAGAPR